MKLKPATDRLFPFLTSERISRYRREGFLHVPGFFSNAEVASMRKAFRRAAKERGMRVADLSQDGRIDDPYHRMVVQLLNLWESLESIRPLVLHPVLAHIARRLSGSRSIRLFHDHALIKAPHSRTETPWHQDSPNLPIDPPKALTCWIALDEVNERNGCLSFIPGSHRWGLLEPVSFVDPRSVFEQQELRGREFESVAMKMKPGDCSFHHANIIHRGGPNLTSKPRRALAIIYIPQGVKYNGKPHPITDEALLRTGGRFCGPRFPLLKF